MKELRFAYDRLGRRLAYVWTARRWRRIPVVRARAWILTGVGTISGKRDKGGSANPA
jgi:hypothetical protein